MTKERRLLITIGAALIALIIAVAAYSLGVYSGAHGWAAGPPSVTGPGQRQPVPAVQGPALQGQQPQPHLLPQLMGQVRSIGSQGMTLATPSGLKSFQFEPGIPVLRAGRDGEQPASLDEVQPGEHLAVFGHFEEDKEGHLVAERLLLVPPPQERAGSEAQEQDAHSPAQAEIQMRDPDLRPQVIGHVQSVSDEGLTLDTARGRRHFQLAPDVVVLRRAQGSEEPATLEEVQPGEHLAVFGRFQASGVGQLVAERLVLLPPAP